jgi:hypothetical protein
MAQPYWSMGAIAVPPANSSTVTPEIKQIEEADAVAYVLSSNINRRHLTKGQRAMALAMLTPERQQGKRRTSAVSAEGVSYRRVAEARMVLALAPELAKGV